MDEFSTLARDYGFRPQGKAAPMKSGLGSDGGDRRHWSSSTTSSPLFDDQKSDMFNDVYGGPPKYSSTSSKPTNSKPSSTFDFQYDTIFQNSAANESKSKVSSSGPIYDKPVFDDDILDGMPGLKNKPMSSSAKYNETENIFASLASSPARKSDNYDDLLGGLGGKEKMEAKSSKGQKDFDDLLPGFGSSSSPPVSNRPSSESSKSTKSTSNSNQTASSSTVIDDPFIVSPSEVFIDPLEDLNKFNTSSKPKAEASINAGVFEDIDPLNSFGSNAKEQPQKTASIHPEIKSQKKSPHDDDLQQDSHQQPIFDIPADSESHKPNVNQKIQEKVQPPEDVWLTVSEIPLFTQPTRARPPSRPPPPVPYGKRHNKRHIEFTHSPRPNHSTPKAPVQETEKDYDNDKQEEEERERLRVEKERQRVKEIEREREKARQAVERANREARDRAAMEARRKVERAAVQRAQTEARERAAAEARERAERAAAEARERAEKANIEARERETRRRAERTAVARAAAEARERAAVEAQERAAAHARMSQQKPDDDLESFFSTSSRPSSAAKSRANSSDSAPEPRFQSRGDASKTASSSSGVSSNMKKASSTTNIFDDLTSILGNGASSGGEFQDIEGETEERRRARLERHQRTQERAAKALAEKNQRDRQTQRDQEERHRHAETLDFEIKRWSAGKEGNLRSLLSTLQYVLWPECGWQPVSLTDLMTGASVKKAYRKATLCIHPDKVQQKGATLQQKYVAEKVFDLLKEAWNKFNSEELF